MRRTCEICNSDDSVCLVEFPISEPSSKKREQTLRVVCCSVCGFVFNDIDRTQIDFDRSYELHSKYSNTSLYFGNADDSNVVADAPWDLSRLAATAEFISTRFSKATSVLDIGSATGALLGFLQSEGFSDLTASDPSPQAIATATRRYGVSGLVGSLFNLCDMTHRRYGLIVLSHVLEHIREAKDALRACESLLDESGLIYIEVPDASRYSEYFIAPYHDFNTEHINHFTEISLENLVRAAGLEVVFVEPGECLCSPSDMYPVIRMIAQVPKVADVSTDEHFYLVNRESEEHIESLRKFIFKSETEISHILARVSELESTQAVVCWGYGQLSYKLLPLLKDRLNVVAVTDGSKDKWGLEVPALGANVVAPHEVPVDCIFIVMSRHHSAAIIDSINEQFPDASHVVLLE